MPISRIVLSSHTSPHVTRSREFIYRDHHTCSSAFVTGFHTPLSSSFSTSLVNVVYPVASSLSFVAAWFCTYSQYAMKAMNGMKLTHHMCNDHLQGLLYIVTINLSSVYAKRVVLFRVHQSEILSLRSS